MVLEIGLCSLYVARATNLQRSWCCRADAKTSSHNGKFSSIRYAFTGYSLDYNVLWILSYNIPYPDFESLENRLLIPFFFRVQGFGVAEAVRRRHIVGFFSVHQSGMYIQDIPLTTAFRGF